MNGMNFFSWLRDGVRRSVLLGVNDAVEQLGTPSNDDALHPSALGFLQLDRNSQDGLKLAASATTTSSRGKKRLGKSLKDIGAEKSN